MSAREEQLTYLLGSMVRSVTHMTLKSLVEMCHKSLDLWNNWTFKNRTGSRRSLQTKQGCW